MRTRWCLVVLGCLAVSAPAAAVDEAGTESALVLGAGARALAMGRTGVAAANDANALFWNPARLAALEQSEISLFRTELFVDGILYHAGALAYPSMNLGTFALGYQRLDVSDIERRDERNQLLGSFSTGESNLLLGYGRSWGTFLSLGGTLRLVQQGVDAASAVGIGMDLGIGLERTLGNDDGHRIAVGASWRNAVEPKLRLKEQEVPDPGSLKIGVAYSSSQPRARFEWCLASDVDMPSTGGQRLGMGAEVFYARTLALRAGLDDGHPTFGVGIAWRNVEFDYALRNDTDLSRNDRFTLAIRLGRTTDERREAQRAERERAVSEQMANLLREREIRERRRSFASADSLATAGSLEEAARLYRRLLVMDPSDTQAAQGLDTAEFELAVAAADKRLRAGENAQAAAKYQEILQRWPAHPRAVAGLTAARARLRVAADRDEQLNALLRDAMTRLTNEDLVGAQVQLEELVRLQPNHAMGQELLQNVRTSRQAKGQAEFQRARSLAAAGNFVEAQQHLTAARGLLGDSKAMAALGKEWADAAIALKASPVPVVPSPAAKASPVPRPQSLSAAERRELDRQYQQGLKFFQSGAFDAAIRSWQAVWNRDPHFERVGEYLIKAYLYEGIARYANGQYDSAMELCQRVLDIEPNNEKAWRYLERIREEKKELQEIEGGTR